MDRFRFRPGDLKAWSNLQDVEVIVWHSWNTSRVRVAEIDAAKSVVRFTGPTVFRPLAWDPAQRYQVENARELLDSPGEWYLDRPSGVLSYWPLAGQDMTKAEVVAPVLEELVRFDGDPDKGRFVEHVRLVGLSLQHADWTLPDKLRRSQAAITVPAVVSARARHVTIQQCGSHTWALTASGSAATANNRIAQNPPSWARRGAVNGDRSDRPSQPQRGDQQLSHDGGCCRRSACGSPSPQRNLAQRDQLRLRGSPWAGTGLSPNRTSHNRITGVVHHVVRHVSDAGGIYAGRTARHRDPRQRVPTFSPTPAAAMAWGIYFDQGSSGLWWRTSCITLRAASWARWHRGAQQRLRAERFGDRLALGLAEGPAIRSSGTFHLTQGELFRADGAPATSGKWDNNVYWRRRSPIISTKKRSPNGRHGVDRHSLVADPQFVDPAHFDFRLRPGSPALKLGIQSIDTSRVGLFGPAEWVNLPKQAQFAPTMLPKPPAASEPTPINDDFEETPVGQSPALAKLFEEGSGDSIRVTDETAASGKHSLKLTGGA